MMRRNSIPAILTVVFILLPLGQVAFGQADTQLEQQQQDCQLAGGALQPLPEGGFICWFDDGSYIACPDPSLQCGYVETQSMLVNDGFLITQSAAGITPLKEDDDDAGESDDFNSGDEEQDRHWCQITQGEYSDWGDYFGDSYENVYSCSYENGSSFTCIRDSYCFYNTGNDSDQDDTDASSSPGSDFQGACVAGGGSLSQWDTGFGCDFQGRTDVVCTSPTDCGPGWVTEHWKFNALQTLQSGGVVRAIEEDNPRWANMIIGPNSIFGLNDIIGPNSGYRLAAAVSVDDAAALVEMVRSGGIAAIQERFGSENVFVLANEGGPSDPDCRKEDGGSRGGSDDDPTDNRGDDARYDQEPSGPCTPNILLRTIAEALSDDAALNTIYLQNGFWHAHLLVQTQDDDMVSVFQLAEGFTGQDFNPDTIVEIAQGDQSPNEPISVVMRWEANQPAEGNSCGDAWICFPKPISALGPWLVSLFLLPSGFALSSAILWRRAGLGLLEFARVKPLSLLLSLAVGSGLTVGSLALVRGLYQSGVIQLERVTSRDHQAVGIAYPDFAGGGGMNEQEGNAELPAPTQTPPAGSDDQWVTVQDEANCRTGPGTAWPSMLLLQQNDVLGVLGRNEESTWLLVETDEGDQCWVSSGLVEGTIEYDQVVILPEPARPTATSTLVLPTATEALGSISGYVWKDVNGDGIKQSGDGGIASVTVLIGAGACPSTGLGSTVTNVHGRYVFDSLPGGTYCITPQVVPACGEYSINPVPGTSATVSIGSGADKFQNFGYKKWVC